ncbi:MAG: universal stress protein [Desulfosarcinaceae bacterium]|nr:universal stress protein [Desulfosarcinaceae bacterium]
MLPDVKSILFATDLSANALFAFRYAAYLAKQCDAQISILHVMEPPSADAMIAMQAYFDREYRDQKHQERIQQALSTIQGRLEKFCQAELAGDPIGADLVLRKEVRSGYPAEMVLRQVARWSCDMIVMGANAKGARQTFLGTVAKQVLRRARVPVVVVPMEKPLKKEKR